MEESSLLVQYLQPNLGYVQVTGQQAKKDLLSDHMLHSHGLSDLTQDSEMNAHGNRRYDCQQ